MSPNAGSRGQNFIVEAAGFAPGQPATIDVYLGVHGQYQYVTSIITPTNDLGRAHYLLTTSASDPPGDYCFIGRGRSYHCVSNYNQLILG